MASEYKPNFVVNTVTASTTLTADGYAGTTIVLNAAAGLTLTLPDATGSGCSFEVIVGTTVTSNSYLIKVPDANNTMVGNALLAQDAGDSAVMFEAGATADTITMNGTTTGGLAGTRVRLIDIAADKWFVDMVGAATGTEATPFSATV